MKTCATCRHSQQIGCVELVVLLRCSRTGANVGERDGCEHWEHAEPQRRNGNRVEQSQTPASEEQS